MAGTTIYMAPEVMRGQDEEAESPPEKLKQASVNSLNDSIAFSIDTSSSCLTSTGSFDFDNASQKALKVWVAINQIDLPGSMFLLLTRW
jgi:serine/threonine protein kinase